VVYPNIMQVIPDNIPFNTLKKKTKTA